MKRVSKARFNKDKWLLLAVVGLFVVGGAITLLRSQAAVPTPTSGFVTRSGPNLMLDGQEFRFSGPNIYWLGLDENVGGVDYPTKQRIDDAFRDAKSMGATAVRAHTLGISVGCAKCISPALGQYNEAAFDTIDYSIMKARDNGLKLQIPLIDQWNYYHGGKSTFLNWRGLAPKDSDRDSRSNIFHTNPQVIQDYKNYISHILNHTNKYTGVALKNDPTIMMWETGNEVFTWTGEGKGGDEWWSQQWTADIAAHIKSLAPKHLVMDGRGGNEEHVLTEAQYAAALAEPLIDAMSIHHYPMRTANLLTSTDIATRSNKAIVMGEYDWTNKAGQGDSLDSFLAAIEGSGMDGDMYWSLFPTYVNHNDGYTLHYPGDDDNMKARVTKLTDHARKMSGLSGPITPLPPPTPPVVIPGNVLQNPSFETNATKNGNPRTTFDPWWLEIKTGADATLSQDTTTYSDGGSSARVNINATDAFYKVQLLQHVATTSGSRYTASFWAKAATPRRVVLAIQQAVSPNTLYQETSFAVTTEWKQYSVVYNAAVSNSDTLFALNVADATGAVWIDNAGLTTQSGGTTPPPPSGNGDANGDGRVNALDLSILLSRDRQNYPPADFNGDGTVGSADMAILLGRWTW